MTETKKPRRPSARQELETIRKFHENHAGILARHEQTLGELKCLLRTAETDFRGITDWLKTFKTEWTAAMWRLHAVEQAAKLNPRLDGRLTHLEQRIDQIRETLDESFSPVRASKMLEDLGGGRISSLSVLFAEGSPPPSNK